VTKVVDIGLRPGQIAIPHAQERPSEQNLLSNCSLVSTSIDDRIDVMPAMSAVPDEGLNFGDLGYGFGRMTCWRTFQCKGHFASG